MEAPTKASNNFDNTRLSTFKTCPRKFFIRHVLGWRGDGTASPLAFGGAWHEGMDATWRNAKSMNQEELTNAAFQAFLIKWEEEGYSANMSLAEMDMLKARTPGTAHEMYYNYINQRWAMLQEAEIIAIEQPFAVPLPGIKDTWYIGRLDKTIHYNGQKIILEHKTTTAYATQGGFRPDFIESWYSSAQCKGYEFAGNIFYEEISGVWVDAALVHKKVHDQFRFVPIKHSRPLLIEWINDAKHWAENILKQKELFMDAGELRNGNFPRNEESCFGKYGKCPYLDICRSCDDPSKLSGPPVGYVEDRWEPFDVLKMHKLAEDDND